MSETNHPPLPEKIWHHAILGSTNTQAKALLQEGERPPFWVMAEQQTAGRGRKGRHWVSEPGNLFITVVKRFEEEANTLTSMSLVTALAVKEAIESATSPELKVTLKWPNDILLNDAKISGILIESHKACLPQATTSPATDLIIGVGVNLISHPNLVGKKAGNLKEAGFEVTPTILRDAIEISLNKWLSIWNKGEGQAAIIQAWQQQAMPLGTPLSIKAGATIHKGKFGGLDAQGCLKLILENNKIETITAGEVL